MLGVLDGVEEYNNAGALLGLDAVDNEELLGALRRMNPIQRMRTINKLASGVPASKGSRAEMEKHFNELPQHIKDGLMKGELRLADTVIYSIKAVNSKTIKMFETQDDKEVGLRNISNAKLPKNQALLVSGIFLLAGIPAEVNKDKIIGAKYDGIEDFAALSNGEFSLKSNKKIIMPETVNTIFKTKTMNTVPVGYYKLANPRMIHDDILIEATIDLGSMEGLDPKTHVYVGLHGTITTP
ncbi:MAG: hypothetical protein LCH32_01115 [Bacteroidetes bacterium]|jgi:hypothetical protein|nr:hypothetical protein [Bacteroidia bacterium]MCA0429082.1 hypothetical protein [Bacteroidota bacterium]